MTDQEFIDHMEAKQRGAAMRRVTAGVYEDDKGRQVRRSLDSLDHTVWLVLIDGEWVQSFATKREAVRSLRRMDGTAAVLRLVLNQGEQS